MRENCVVVLRCYLLQQNCSYAFNPLLVVCENGPRMTKEKDHKPEREEESEEEVRDLPPKKDVKGGNSKEKGRDTGRTGEVDFMRGFD